MLTRTEAKEKAQEIIMDQICQASFVLWDERNVHSDLPYEDAQLVQEYLDKQKERIEKLFGYEPGSWSWG